MRQPRTGFPVIALRTFAGTATPAISARAHWSLQPLASMAFPAGSQLIAFIALLASGLRPASLRTTSTPTGVPFAATDAQLHHLSLLILAFIEGAFAWVIVINTGQSAGAAPRAPDMDRRQYRPPRATLASPGRGAEHRRSCRSILHQVLQQTSPVAWLPSPALHRCAQSDVVNLHLRVQLKDAERAPRPSASPPTEPARPRVWGPSSAISRIRAFAGTTGAEAFAAR